MPMKALHREWICLAVKTISSLPGMQGLRLSDTTCRSMANWNFPKEMRQSGHIGTYGIYFDFDKADIETEQSLQLKR